MLEDMIKTTPKMTVSNSLRDNHKDSFDIDFSKVVYTAGSKTLYINHTNGTMTPTTNETSTFSKPSCFLNMINFGTKETSKFLLSRINIGSYPTPAISADGKTLTVNYKFELSLTGEYIWDNNMSFMTNEGLNIEFMLDKGKWKDEI